MTYLLGITLAVSYFLWSFSALVRNVLLAKSIGIPVLFAHATPGKLGIFTVDAAISNQVLTKEREFPKPFEVAQILDVYGPSLGSVDDENWARHRKITAGSFADKNSQADGRIGSSGIRRALHYEGHPDAVEKNEEARDIIEAGGPTSGMGLKGLRDDELYGNLFVYSFGGHETTAHTLSYAIYLLAAFPDVQDWLTEELKAISCDLSAEAAFDDAFPHLKRCLAVMFETLRVFPMGASMPKTTGPTSSSVMLDGKDYTLPPRVRVYVNIPTLHVHPDHWGSDSVSWKPSRWIECSGRGEQMRAPTKGAFMPWGDGPRVCPGRKFAQVEFVATIAAMFSEYRVEVLLQYGESFKESRERSWQVVQDLYVALTLTMSNSEAVSLRLVKR